MKTTTEQRIQEAEQYAEALRSWLANPNSRKSNPVGAADRERELARTEERLTILKGVKADEDAEARYQAANLKKWEDARDQARSKGDLARAEWCQAKILEIEARI